LQPGGIRPFTSVSIITIARPHSAKRVAERVEGLRQADIAILRGQLTHTAQGIRQEVIRAALVLLGETTQAVVRLLGCKGSGRQLLSYYNNSSCITPGHNISFVIHRYIRSKKFTNWIS